MIGLLLLVPIGSIATYLEKPDALFLLVKEEEVKRYIKGQAKKSFCVLVFDSKFCPFYYLCLFFWQRGWINLLL